MYEYNLSARREPDSRAHGHADITAAEVVAVYPQAVFDDFHADLNLVEGFVAAVIGNKQDG